MKELDTMAISRVGQGTLPKWWREVSGLSKGGLVEVRPLRDGKHSLVLTPKRAGRHGATGLLKLFARCPAPMPPSARHPLPSK